MSYEPRSLNPNIMEKRINDLSKAVGGGGIGTIPIASADTVGGIMIGGSANPITITGSGNASVRKATSELLGVVKAGDGISVDADGAISGIPYSTTEHKTGKKWIDGKDIYEKVIDVGVLPNSTTKQVAHGVTYDKVVSLRGICSNSDNTYLPLPAVATASQYAIELSIDNTNVVITTAQNRSAFSGYVILEYTK